MNDFANEAIVNHLASRGLQTKSPLLGASNRLGYCFSLILLFSLLALPSLIFAQAHDNKPMALSGYSISQAYDVEDDLALDLEDPVITRLLYRIKKTSPKSRAEYSLFSQDLTWSRIVNETPDFRFWVFNRRVQLRRITKHRFANAAKDSEIKGVFVCHCENEKGDPLLVLSRTLPRSLQTIAGKETKFDEPIELQGFLFARSSGLKLDNLNDTESTVSKIPVFVADRIGWYPENDSTWDAAHVVLAKSGADMGQIDFVQQNNTRRLNKDDAEAFYQIMAAVKKTSLPDGVAERLSFLEIMQNPKSNFCRAASIKGVLRRCTKIPINNIDIINRLGISEYYELIVFPDLDGGKIMIKNKSGKDLEYRRFPITVCCAELPEGMSPSDLERNRVEIDGYFYRFWKYQSDKTDEAGTTGQVSPLIMAKRPLKLEPQSSNLNLILLVFASLVIAAIAIMLWSYRREDRIKKSPGQKILETLPDKLDLTGISD